MPRPGGSPRHAGHTMIMWRAGTVRIVTRDAAALTSVRDGLVSEDDYWGLHLDGERIAVTHLPSGKRLARFPSLGQAVEAVAELVRQYPKAWVVSDPNDVLTDEDLVHVKRILDRNQIQS